MTPLNKWPSMFGLDGDRSPKITPAIHGTTDPGRWGDPQHPSIPVVEHFTEKPNGLLEFLLRGWWKISL